MRRILPILLGMALLLMAGAACDSAWAQGRSRDRDGRDGARPLEELLPDIRRQHPGNLAGRVQQVPGPSGESRYRMNWLTPDGRVLWLDVDPRTGRVTGVTGGERGRN